jgi:biopolymer transport protein TolR
MAHIESGGGGRKKTFEPNLVPFIDLMSVLITFLLISAVWTQVSMIQIGSSIYSKRSDDKPTTPPPMADVVLKLEIRNNNYILTAGKDIVTLPMVNGEFDDAGLLVNLKKIKEKFPAKLDGSIAMADDLPYERLIHSMDSFLQAGFPKISVLTGGPN